jgi:hypothetical protein
VKNGRINRDVLAPVHWSTHPKNTCKPVTCLTRPKESRHVRL